MEKSVEKLDYINKSIDKLNKRLVNRTFKVSFENKGANNYCLIIKDEYYSFNTCDDVINCLVFIDKMFEVATEEIRGGMISGKTKKKD